MIFHFYFNVSIFEEFRSKNCGDVYQPVDIAALPLAMVDRVADGLAAKYKAGGIGEGAAAGSAGASGLMVDVPLLTTMALPTLVLTALQSSPTLIRCRMTLQS